MCHHHPAVDPPPLATVGLAQVVVVAVEEQAVRGVLTKRDAEELPLEDDEGAAELPAGTARNAGVAARSSLELWAVL